MTEKECSKCVSVKSLDCFRKDKKSPDGLDYWCKSCRHNYYIINADTIKERSGKWDKQNPESRRLRKRSWDRKAMLNSLHRIGNNMRSNMHHALKAKKNGRKWEGLTGYTLQDLINHINPLLVGEMTWENYGSVWHLDHITPKSWFKYQTTDDPQFRECWALSNLQPKFAIDNIKKGNRYAG